MGHTFAFTERERGWGNILMDRQDVSSSCKTGI